MAGGAAQAPLEELRLALVLNGGVSLAVWMGGVTREVDLLVRAYDHRGSQAVPDLQNPYAALLSATRTTATVDVVAGTSAGGINGAALCLSLANVNAELGALRDLWAEQGDIAQLLRPPFQGQPNSLLRGDDFFLPALTRAMRGLTAEFEPTHANIDLTMTTTLLTGAVTVTTDDLGQRIPQNRHGASLRFTTEGADGTSDFSESTVAETARAMALAARSTAGFPVAFEPTYLPVDEAPAGVPGGSGPSRPDLARWASWSTRNQGVHSLRSDAVDCSRFAIDGGVLANTPTKLALAAIDAQKAMAPVRRQMLLVYPHAPSVDERDPRGPCAKPAEAPTVTATLSGLFGALSSQGSLTFVDEIERHNREALRWRGGRQHVVEADPDPAAVYELLRPAWTHYRRARIQAASRTLADRSPRPTNWTYLRIAREVETAHRQWLAETGELPYVPGLPPPAVPGPPTQWPWGPDVALGIADTVMSVIIQALGVARADETPALMSAAQQLSDARGRTVRARDDFDEIWWSEPGAADVTPHRGYWRLRMLAYRRAMIGAHPGDADELATLVASCGLGPGAAARIEAVDGEPGERIAEAVTTIVTQLAAALPTLAAIDADPARCRLAGLSDWLAFFGTPPAAGEPTDDLGRLRCRLLALDAATWLVADAETPGTSQAIKLAQLTLDIEHGFTTATATRDDKVAGTELHRFGGFLKQSWRVNDWTWGRLDAAAMMCRLVLDPDRLRRVHALSGQSVEEFADALVTKLRDAPVEGKKSADASTRAAAEVRALLQDDETHDGYLPELSRLAALPVQHRIIVEELPALRAAIQADDAAKRSAGPRGRLFLEQSAGLADRIEDAGPEAWRTLGAKALTAFDRAGIGREPIEEEARSDGMIQTTVNAAAGIVTLLDSDRLGIKALKPVSRAVRGAALVPYWLITGLTSGGTAARSLALLGFATGGVLLSLSLLGVLGGLSSVGSTVGVGILLGALGYAALRSGTLLHGVILLGPVVPLLAYAFDVGPPGADAGSAVGTAASADAAVEAARAGVSVIAVLALTAGLVALASLPYPLLSPLATLRRRSRRALTITGLTLLVVAAGAWALVHWWGDVQSGLSSAYDWLTAPSRADLRRWLALAATAVAVLLALVGGWVRGRGMRRWSQAGNETWRLETQASHPAAVAAGWAAVYGVVYVAMAWATYLTADAWLDTWPTWLVVTIVWSATLGAALCLLGPTWITWRARKHLRTSLQHLVLARSKVAKGRSLEDHLATDFLTDLERRGRVFGYLVVAATWSERLSGKRLTGSLVGRPVLSKRGQALLGDYRRLEAARSGAGSRRRLRRVALAVAVDDPVDDPVDAAVDAAAGPGVTPATSSPAPPPRPGRSSAAGRRRSR